MAGQASAGNAGSPAGTRNDCKPAANLIPQSEKGMHKPARMQLVASSNRLTIQRRPSSWYSRISPPVTPSGWNSTGGGRTSSSGACAAAALQTKERKLSVVVSRLQLGSCDFGSGQVKEVRHHRRPKLHQQDPHVWREPLEFFVLRLLTHNKDLSLWNVRHFNAGLQIASKADLLNSLQADCRQSSAKNPAARGRLPAIMHHRRSPAIRDCTGHVNPRVWLQKAPIPIAEQMSGCRNRPAGLLAAAESCDTFSACGGQR